MGGIRRSARLALALSLAATAVLPELAVPLFVGGLAVGVLGVRAALEQSEIVDRLAGERDAYVISGGPQARGARRDNGTAAQPCR